MKPGTAGRKESKKKGFVTQGFEIIPCNGDVQFLDDANWHSF